MKIKKIIFFCLIFFCLPFSAFASDAIGTIDPVYKYAWGENIGWINFGGTGNVSVSDNELSGYAWSENYGWINLSPANGGVTNDEEGNLEGYAWGENIGWIDFSNVSINSEGYFLGYASSSVSGQISLNCQNTNTCDLSNFKVKTTWGPKSKRLSPLPQGAFSSPSPPSAPKASGTEDILKTDGFKILINAGAAETDNPIVSLEFNAGSDVAKMAISKNNDFSNVGQEDYKNTKSWNLCSASGNLNDDQNCPVGTYLIYAKFYTKFGRPSEIISSRIILTEKNKNNPAIKNIDGSLAKEKNKPAVYLIENGKKRPILSAQIFEQSGWLWKNIVTYANLENYPLGEIIAVPFLDGKLVKEKNKPAVYLIENGKKRPILSAEVFIAKGFSWKNIKEVSDLSAFSLGEIIK